MEEQLSAPTVNGDIPRFLANGDGPEGLRWRRRAVRSFGQTGTCEVWRYACPRLTLFAPSRSRALRKLPDGNLRRSLVGSLRALTSAKLVIGEASRRPVWASSSPRSIRSQRESAMGRRTTRRGPSPFARKTAPHASAATIRSFVPIWRAIAHVPEGGKDRKTRCSGSCRALESRTLFPAAVNGDALRLPVRGDRAVRVGAPSEG